eukprot:7206683-Prymnesium_polylepis.1
MHASDGRHAHGSGECETSRGLWPMVCAIRWYSGASTPPRNKGCAVVSGFGRAGRRRQPGARAANLTARVRDLTDKLTVTCVAHCCAPRVSA